MKWNVFLPYVAVMALVTYLIRMLPLTVFRRRIKSRFIRSFLYYVPYATLAAITFPAILSATANRVSAGVGFAVALVLSYCRRSLIFVALAACAAVFIVERIMEYIVF